MSEAEHDHPSRRGIVVAIDGPAGSGKSSTARAVAGELGYVHLDSGAFYRALTWAALREGIPSEWWDRLAASELDRLRVEGDVDAANRTVRVTVAGREVAGEIRTPEVTAHVSRMAAAPAVRAWLLGALRAAGRRGGVVAEGRDIGSVVFPDAELKVFLVCEPEQRARRRLLEQGIAPDLPDAVAAEIRRLEQRDKADSSRAVAPLVRAPDAVVIDTGGLNLPEQVEQVVRLARERGAGVD